MEALGINAGFLIFQLVNFGFLAIVAYMFGWRKFLDLLDKRAETIAKGLEDARIASDARSNAEAEAQNILAQARAEAQKITAEARASAEERAKPIMQAAENEAAKIREDARLRAEELQASALSGVRGQVINLAMAAAQKLIGSGDSKQQEKIVTDFFTKSPHDLKGLGDNVVVTTALPLDDKEQADIKKSIGASQVEFKVDPSILGGVVVRSGDKVVDGSFRSSLAGLSGSLS
jgi:F-type H+-transporting ATPase subunit b